MIRFAKTTNNVNDTNENNNDEIDTVERDVAVQKTSSTSSKKKVQIGFHGPHKDNLTGPGQRLPKISMHFHIKSKKYNAKEINLERFRRDMLRHLFTSALLSSAAR